MHILALICLGILVLLPVLALSVTLHYYSPIHGGRCRHDRERDVR